MLAVIGIIYGALVAMVQPDMKKLVAYSSVSHLGFVVLGIAAMNMQGVQGAVYQMLNHGVSTGGLFLIVGMLSDRRHTRLIAEFGGLKKVDAAAGGGVPDHHAVVDRPARAERLRRRVPDPARRVPLGSAAGGVRRDRRDPVGRLHALDVPARELRTGEQREERGAARISRPREWAMLVPIVALAVLMGVLPNLFLRPIEPSVERMREPGARQQRRRRADPGRSSRQSAVEPAVSRSATGLQSAVADCHDVVPQRHRADGVRHRGGHRRDGRRGVPRSPGERMPIGPLGAIGLRRAPRSRPALLWDRNAVSFGVVAADNFGLFVTWILIVVGLLSLAFSGPTDRARAAAAAASTTR